MTDYAEKRKAVEEIDNLNSEQFNNFLGKVSMFRITSIFNEINIVTEFNKILTVNIKSSQDNSQYLMNGILRYEKIFGRGFISTGGITTTKVICRNFY